ncbi:hypothetical protein M5689_008525 [Euphorbia peplus]|nr:hypothetical protein M5689_008525 [Euphorbia peplus]
MVVFGLAVLLKKLSETSSSFDQKAVDRGKEPSDINLNKGYRSINIISRHVIFGYGTSVQPILVSVKSFGFDP